MRTKRENYNQKKDKKSQETIQDIGPIIFIVILLHIILEQVIPFLSNKKRQNSYEEPDFEKKFKHMTIL